LKERKVKFVNFAKAFDKNLIPISLTPDEFEEDALREWKSKLRDLRLICFSRDFLKYSKLTFDILSVLEGF